MGVLLGALFSVLPLELACLGVPLLGVIVLPRLRFDKEAPRRWRGRAVLAVSALATMRLAVAAPTKYEDRPFEVPLSSDQLELPVLLSELDARGIHTRHLSASPEVVVSLPSRLPTLHQLDDALRTQAGLSLEVGKCGTGATLLWGPHPIAATVYPVEDASSAR